jgi:phage shock protein PspC (stress-responsive transcriptional regulator)
MRNPLYRSRTDRMIFGVAGGMAEWFDVDPSVVRLVWALLILAGGVGLLLYIVAAIVVPEAPLGYAGGPGPDATPEARAAWDERQARRLERRQGRGSPGVVFGAALVIIGGWLLLRRYLPAFDTSWVIPGVLILVGLALVVGAMNRSNPPGPG